MISLRDHGFMLVELIIAMVAALMVCTTACAVCSVYQRYHRNQQLMVATQQNLSGAVVVMEQQFRMAGYDPKESGQFGIVDVRRYDLVDAGRVNDQGQPAIFYTYDRNADGVLEGGPHERNGEHPSFRIQQGADGGEIYLSHDNGSGRRPLAGGIAAMGLAYAIDADEDGRLDTWRNNDHVIWAVDSDNDNRLDTHLDTDDNGRITAEDDTNGDGRIDGSDGAPLSTPIPLHHIRSVRIWLLAVSQYPIKGYWDDRRHVVGDRVLAPTDDARLWRLMETTVDCRNL